MAVTAERLAVIGSRPFVNPHQAARLMGKSKQTIHEAMYSGELEYILQGHKEGSLKRLDGAGSSEIVLQKIFSHPNV